MLGRPKSKNPKTHEISVRFTEREWGDLKEHCESERISVAEAVRQGIRLLINRRKRKLGREKKKE